MVCCPSQVFFPILLFRIHPHFILVRRINQFEVYYLVFVLIDSLTFNSEYFAISQCHSEFLNNLVSDIFVIFCEDNIYAKVEIFHEKHLAFLELKNLRNIIQDIIKDILI